MRKYGRRGVNARAAHRLAKIAAAEGQRYGAHHMACRQADLDSAVNKPGGRKILLVAKATG